MSKFAKGSLITAGVFLAIGFALCLISCIIGGRRILTDGRLLVGNWEWAEDSCEWVEDRLDDMNITFNHGVWSGNWDYDYDYPRELLVNGDEVSGNKTTATVAASEVDKLDLSLGAGEFIIEEKDTADNNIDIKVKGLGECDYYVSDGTFYIEAFKDVTNANDGRNSITLSLPKGAKYTTVDAVVGAGLMKIDFLKAQDFSIDLGAGEMCLESMEVDDLTAQIGAGRMKAEDMQIKNADLNVNLGMCEFDGSITGNMIAECAMGTLNMDLTGKHEDHNYNIECSAGTINMDGFGSVAVGTDKTINNNANSTYTLTCNLGTVSIEFED